MKITQEEKDFVLAAVTRRHCAGRLVDYAMLKRDTQYMDAKLKAILSILTAEGRIRGGTAREWAYRWWVPDRPDKKALILDYIRTNGTDRHDHLLGLMKAMTGLKHSAVAAICLELLSDGRLLIGNISVLPYSAEAVEELDDETEGDEETQL